MTDHRGMMLVLSSPSGAGKTTLSRMLLDRDPGFVMSVSATTRPPRPGEVDGRDYFFVDHDRFASMVENDELLEYATVFGNSYGTPKEPVLKAIGAGKDVLFDIDWQGTQQVAEHSRNDLVKIFILPPSMAELEQRLKKRAQDSAQVVAKRMSEAPQEIGHWAEYDYVVINEDLEASFDKIHTIIAAERLRLHRQTGLSKFVKSLIG
ncbi:MAG: guanylate kinase [Sphingomonadales bacterium]